MNDTDIYRIVKEEVDFDPTKTETLDVTLNINEKKDSGGSLEWSISGSMPWIIDDVADRVESALGTSHLRSINMKYLSGKSWVTNEFLDLMCSYDISEQGLEKLTFTCFLCEPFEQEVVSRLANMCPRLSHLQMSEMWDLKEAGMLSMVNLFRQIIQNNPPIEVLNMWGFSCNNDKDGSISEHVLETLFSSNIDSFTDLNLSNNESWFKYPRTKEERS